MVSFAFAFSKRFFRYVFTVSLLIESSFAIDSEDKPWLIKRNISRSRKVISFPIVARVDHRAYSALSSGGHRRRQRIAGVPPHSERMGGDYNRSFRTIFADKI